MWNVISNMSSNTTFGADEGLVHITTLFCLAISGVFLGAAGSAIRDAIRFGGHRA